MPFITLNSLDQLPTSGTYAIYKHSTCPISSRARSVIKTFLTGTPLDVYELHVVEQRPLSNEIASSYGVTHESPQILMITGGKVTADESHLQITKEWLEKNR
jgi:bacillithiol system protein YtxJ